MPGWLESAASTEARSIAWLKYRVSAPCSGSSAPGGGLISTIPGGSETAGVGVGGRGCAGRSCRGQGGRRFACNDGQGTGKADQEQQHWQQSDRLTQMNCGHTYTPLKYERRR